jgi:hypothetical protein
MLARATAGRSLAEYFVACKFAVGSLGGNQRLSEYMHQVFREIIAHASRDFVGLYKLNSTRLPASTKCLCKSRSFVSGQPLSSSMTRAADDFQALRPKEIGICVFYWCGTLVADDANRYIIDRSIIAGVHRD